MSEQRFHHISSYRDRMQMQRKCELSHLTKLRIFEMRRSRTKCTIFAGGLAYTMENTRIITALTNTRRMIRGGGSLRGNDTVK